MKAFLSYSYENKEKFKKLNKILKKFLKEKFNIDSYSFVFEFKEKTNNKTMMKKALKLIDNSHLIIAELSYKSIGIGIEIGYAKAKNKKIIYLKKTKAEISTTSEGISDY
ncbi:MAG: nucleoside 2-deoxyribosyltransferase, partial [Candidatus Omnitrophica bacterium]|nr:nucleoside 2-deoxyribosyltransferase [Candidatus Omnitrophota bacterium]